VVQREDLVMILDLHRQGLSVAITRQLTLDRKTVRKDTACGLGRPPTRRAHRASITSIPSPPICASASPPIPR